MGQETRNCNWRLICLTTGVGDTGDAATAMDRVGPTGMVAVATATDGRVGALALGRRIGVVTTPGAVATSTLGVGFSITRGLRPPFSIT